MGQDGRITAPAKPDGGVPGTMVGDILRRLVARTMAQQVSTEAEAATALLQYAPSTRAGCKCVAYVTQSLTDQNPEATVVSTDAVRAYDLISRNAMLEDLLQMENVVRCSHSCAIYTGASYHMCGGDEMAPYTR